MWSPWPPIVASFNTASLPPARLSLCPPIFRCANSPSEGAAHHTWPQPESRELKPGPSRRGLGWGGCWMERVREGDMETLRPGRGTARSPGRKGGSPDDCRGIWALSVRQLCQPERPAPLHSASSPMGSSSRNPEYWWSFPAKLSAWTCSGITLLPHAKLSPAQKWESVQMPHRCSRALVWRLLWGQ